MALAIFERFHTYPAFRRQKYERLRSNFREIIGVSSTFYYALRVFIVQDLQSDWKKWTWFERVSALCGLFTLVLLVPLLAAAALTH